MNYQQQSPLLQQQSHLQQQFLHTQQHGQQQQHLSPHERLHEGQQREGAMSSSWWRRQEEEVEEEDEGRRGQHLHLPPFREAATAACDSSYTKQPQHEQESRKFGENGVAGAAAADGWLLQQHRKQHSICRHLLWKPASAPICLNAKKHPHYVRVLHDGVSAVYLAKGEHTDVGVVQADKPIPTDCALFYFEVTVVNCGASGPPRVCVGLTTRSAAFTRHPGVEPHSIGYLAEDGRKLGPGAAPGSSSSRGSIAAAAGGGESYSAHYGRGDVVGCGIHQQSKKIFFTRNGVFCGVAAMAEPHVEYFPAAGMQATGEQVKFNFLGPFVFDIQSILQSEWLEERQQIEADAEAAAAAHPDALVEIVRGYLLHAAFTNTLQAFDRALAARRKKKGGEEKSGGSSSKAAAEEEGDGEKDDGKTSSTSSQASGRAGGTQEEGTWRAVGRGDSSLEAATAGAAASAAGMSSSSSSSFPCASFSFQSSSSSSSSTFSFSASSSSSSSSSFPSSSSSSSGTAARAPLSFSFSASAFPTSSRLFAPPHAFFQPQHEQQQQQQESGQGRTARAAGGATARGGPAATAAGGAGGGGAGFGAAGGVEQQQVQQQRVQPNVFGFGSSSSSSHRPAAAEEASAAAAEARPAEGGGGGATAATGQGDEDVDMTAAWLDTGGEGTGPAAESRLLMLAEGAGPALAVKGDGEEAYFQESGVGEGEQQRDENEDALMWQPCTAYSAAAGPFPTYSVQSPADLRVTPRVTSRLLASLPLRQGLRRAIEEGRAEEALRILEREFPAVLHQKTFEGAFAVVLLLTQQVIDFLRPPTRDVGAAVRWMRARISHYLLDAVPHIRQAVTECCGLLAYEEPEKSCLGAFFDLSRRTVTATAINRSVLKTHLLVPCWSPLEILVRHLVACRQLMRECCGNRGPVPSSRLYCCPAFLRVLQSSPAAARADEMDCPLLCGPL